MIRPEEIKEIVEGMLAKGDTMLCIDSRHPEAQVPGEHQGKSDLRLVLNLRFRQPISLFPDGIQADLLFNGVLHHCWIPYECLWGVYDPDTGEGTLWPEQMPEDMLETLGKNLTTKGEAAPHVEPAAIPPKEGEGLPGQTLHADSEALPDETPQQTLRSVTSTGTGPRKQTRPGQKPFLQILPGGKKD